VSLTANDTALARLLIGDTLFADGTAYVQIQAAIAGTTSLSARLSAERRLAAQINSATGISGSLTVHRRITATIASTTGMTATLTASQTIAALIASVTGISGVVTVERRIAALYASVTSVSSVLTVARKLVASIASTTTATATLTVERRIAAAIDSVTGLTAALTTTGPSPYDFYETFPAASGDIKDRLSNSGDTWTRDAGLIYDDTGRARTNNGAAESQYRSTTRNSNRRDRVVFNLDGKAVSLGLIFRASNATNFWLAYMATAGTTKYECNAGSFIARASNSHTLSASTDYEADATMNGTALAVTIDGVTLNYTSSFNQSATGIGLYSDFANSGHIIKNMRSEAYP
jgi:hypothetical protein